MSVLDIGSRSINDVIEDSRHCQRNWDLTKDVPQEHIDLFIEAITKSPSKQNLAHYRLHVITNRKTIETIYSHCRFKFNMYHTNPQVLANLLFLFEEIKNTTTMYEGYTNTSYLIERDRDISIGIASGYLVLIANMLEYKTGFCACFQETSLKEVVGLNGRPVLMVGVGYNHTDLDYNIGLNLRAELKKFDPYPKETIEVNIIK